MLDYFIQWRMNHVREEDRGGNLSTMIRLLKYFPTAFIKRLKNYAIHVHACAALFFGNFIACSRFALFHTSHHPYQSRASFFSWLLCPLNDNNTCPQKCGSVKGNWNFIFILQHKIWTCVETYSAISPDTISSIVFSEYRSSGELYFGVLT